MGGNLQGIQRENMQTTQTEGRLSAGTSLLRGEGVPPPHRNAAYIKNRLNGGRIAVMCAISLQLTQRAFMAEVE